MARRTENKIVMVIRHTRLDDLKARFNTEEQARFYVEHLGADFSDYREEDRTYKQAVREAGSIVSRYGRLQIIDRSFVPSFIFGPEDTVVALGQDGLVANVLKYLHGQPLIGVNPDKKRWEGILLPFTVSDLDLVVPEVFSKRRPVAEITMAEAKLNTGETLSAVNDLFIGPRSHTSARYSICIGARSENQSSSGIIVSTGLGSTGWLRSILAGAAGVASALLKEPLKIGERGTVPWNADYLLFSVREPWPSKMSGAEITFGEVRADTPLVLVSQMPENGVIFSDGIEVDFLQFNAGTEALISLSDRRGRLVM